MPCENAASAMACVAPGTCGRARDASARGADTRTRASEAIHAICMFIDRRYSTHLLYWQVACVCHATVDQVAGPTQRQHGFRSRGSTCCDCMTSLPLATRLAYCSIAFAIAVSRIVIRMFVVPSHFSDCLSPLWLSQVEYYSKSVRERSFAFRSAAAAAAVHAAARHHPAAPPASADGRDGCFGPVCVTHARPLDRCVDGRR